jgi:hypothetical protein
MEETTAGGKTLPALLSFAPQFPSSIRARRGKDVSWTAKRCPGAQWSAAGKAFRYSSRETKRGAASALGPVRRQATVSLFRKASAERPAG